MRALLLKTWSAIYPPTKRKLHGLVSIVGTLLTAVVCVGAWLVNKKILTSTGAIGVNLGVLTIWASSYRSVVKPRADKLIDGLDIPEGSTVTQTETASKTTTVTPPAAGVVSTGTDRSEDVTGTFKPRLVPPKPVPQDPNET